MGETEAEPSLFAVAEQFSKLQAFDVRGPAPCRATGSVKPETPDTGGTGGMGTSGALRGVWRTGARKASVSVLVDRLLCWSVILPVCQSVTQTLFCYCSSTIALVNFKIVMGITYDETILMLS